MKKCDYLIYVNGVKRIDCSAKKAECPKTRGKCSVTATCWKVRG